MLRQTRYERYRPRHVPNDGHQLQHWHGTPSRHPGSWTLKPSQRRVLKSLRKSKVVPSSVVGCPLLWLGVSLDVDDCAPGAWAVPGDQDPQALLYLATDQQGPFPDHGAQISSAIPLTVPSVSEAESLFRSTCGCCQIHAMTSRDRVIGKNEGIAWPS